MNSASNSLHHTHSLLVVTSGRSDPQRASARTVARDFFFFLSGGSHTTLFSNIIIFQSKGWRSPAGNSYHVAWLTETARRHLHLLLEISNPPTYATCSPHLLTRLPAWTGALRAFSAFGLTGKAAGKVRITSAYSRGETSRGACPSEQPPFRRAQDGRPRGKRRGESGPKTRPRPDAG